MRSSEICALVTPEVERTIQDFFSLAPLHNPPNLAGIRAAERFFPDIPHVAVFDTAFHQSMPEHAYMYALPYALYAEERVRRYGFHGTSHRFVAGRAAQLLGKPEGFTGVTCHLGNGCSLAAVRCGRSVDTSMGLTPLEGVPMGTRCGDIDPAAVLHLMEHRQLGIGAMNDLLNKQSGMLGLAETGSNDLRDILAARDAGNPQAAVALQAFCYRIKKYIGSYAAAMGGLDVLVFTAGIGENSPEVRRRVCRGLEAPGGLGIALDPSKNSSRTHLARSVHAEGSRVRVLVIPTNEELEIARETLQLVIGIAA